MNMCPTTARPAVQSSDKVIVQFHASKYWVDFSLFKNKVYTWQPGNLFKEFIKEILMQGDFQ